MTIGEPNSKNTPISTFCVIFRISTMGGFQIWFTGWS